MGKLLLLLLWAFFFLLLLSWLQDNHRSNSPEISLKLFAPNW